MLSSQMELRTGVPCDDLAPSRIAYLASHEVAFSMRGEDGQLYANLIPSEQTTIGVLYRCSAASLDVIDNYESGYARHQVTVTDAQGMEYLAIVYKSLPSHVSVDGQVDAAYVDRIVRGGREHGLPEAYLLVLESKGLNSVPAANKMCS